MSQDLIDSVQSLERSSELHAARLLVLLNAFSGDDGSEKVEGLTKLAKLDFLLRYPVLLERALARKGRAITPVQTKDFERSSVESRMVRYRFGPWDHRYRMLLNILVARGLATISLDGRTVLIGLTALGAQKAKELSRTEAFGDVGLRARILRDHFNYTATNLMRFIYDTFPEILTLQSNQEI